MAYLVIAVGALMSLVGVFAIVSGFPIIEVERGWAELISGSTMLAGGLVTVALGLVLKTLLAIRQTLGSGEASVLAATASGATISAERAHVPPNAEASPADSASAFTAPAVVASSAMDGSAAGQADHPHAVASAPFEVEEAQPVYPDHTAMPHDHVAFEPLAPEQAAQDPGVAAPVAHEAAVRETAVIEPASHDAGTVAPIVSEAPPHHVADGYELQTPSTPDHDLAPIDPAPTDDWLDRAFSALDEELFTGARPADHAAPALAAVHAEPRPVSPSPSEAYPEAAGETLEAEAQPAAASPPVPSSPAMPADLAASESPVIGRYESEGTSYVMFADGSIEAQSEAGIYRFRSMAELKAFIEG